MAPTEFDLPDPFVALDSEWWTICRRSRRSGLPRRWTLEPALDGLVHLAGLIPPPGVDRGPISAAMVRLLRDGDELAGRVLLQLCVPGLFQLAARWQSEMKRWNLAAWEVVSRASVYIVRLGRCEITCNGSIAGHLVRSIHRDLVTTARQFRRAGAACQALDDVDVEAILAVETSAEDAVISGPVVMDKLRTVATSGAISPVVALILAHVCCGTTIEDACHRTQVSLPRYYRHRPQALEVLRPQFLLEPV